MNTKLNLTYHYIILKIYIYIYNNCFVFACLICHALISSPSIKLLSKHNVHSILTAFYLFGSKSMSRVGLVPHVLLIQKAVELDGVSGTDADLKMFENPIVLVIL